MQTKGPKQDNRCHLCLREELLFSNKDLTEVISLIDQSIFKGFSCVNYLQTLFLCKDLESYDLLCIVVLYT